MSLKNFWNNVIDCIKKWNNSESSINEGKNKKHTWKDIFWPFTYFSVILLSLYIFKDKFITVIVSIIILFIPLFFLLFWEYSEKKINNDLISLKIRWINKESVFFNLFKEYFIIFKKYIINHVWYTILFLSFLSLTIFFIVLRIKWIEIQIDKHFFPIWAMIFLWLLLTASDTDFTKRSINTTILVIWLSVIPLFISILYLFIYFYDSSWIKIKNNDLIKISTGTNFLYVNGKKLAYIAFTSWNLTKSLEFTWEFKWTDSININNSEKFIISWNKVSINKKQLWEITYTWKNNILTWVIHIFPQPNNKIILSNNKLDWGIAWIKLNNLSWSDKDLEKIYSDTLNSSYVSTYTTGHMLFSSFLTILLFTITIIFLKQTIKTNNQKKEVLNKLRKIGLYIDLTNQEDSKNTIEIKDKILKEIEKDIQIFIPQFPIDNDTKYLDQLTEKIFNMINKKKST